MKTETQAAHKTIEEIIAMTDEEIEQLFNEITGIDTKLADELKELLQIKDETDETE